MTKLPDEAPSSWLPWVLVPLVAFVAFGLGRCVPRLRSPEPESAEVEAEVWTCSMHPQVRQPEPGACPICGMDLIPLSEHAAGSIDQVELSDRAALLARIETVEVERIATPGVDLRLLGRIEIDESRARNVSAWIGGRVDKLLVRETGASVRRGQAIASLYSPEVYAAHQDLLTAARQVAKLGNASELARSSAEATLAAARERLSLLGLSDAEIERMARAKSPRKSVAISATDGGTVMERLVTQGQYVEAGEVLLRVADLSQLWVQLDAYESDLSALMEGQTVEIEVEALPGERFSGEVAFIDPLVDPRRRVTRVRVEVDNASGKLRPGMFVEAVVRGGPSGEGPASASKQKPLVVPVTAPLFTGKRSLVYVEVPAADASAKPSYAPRAVELGPRMGELYPVVAGLAEGERVVVHGAFAIDADLQIRGGASMMAQPDELEDTALAVRVEPDEVLRAELAAVLGAYLDMQVALADDNWRSAQAAAARLVKQAQAVTVAPESPAAELWRALGPALERRASEAAQSEAIEGARGAFLHLSRDIKGLLATFGNPLDSPLRLAFCPMADANEGAEWIQAGEVVDNSYFGESMLSCGEFRSTLEPGQYLLSSEAASARAGATKHEGHTH
ncbi:Cation efflux system protein CusB precursor [Enhygromyxa salina]|uniref:Cation efflux system protein CusB n=1 Tax=Enhygromyxa salina TaxID=215803 RepID=A0A2S9XCQ3_9BACT|nr:efflux RND transporter periplasmic adaptor subunit [Enhygromyxa salina]PRP90643.1 Cation efflux system protein CusB precursor [Enhygromyxa salina]